MESWGSMNNIIVITDSAKIADTEYKELKQNLIYKGLLIDSIDQRWTLYTEKLLVSFWNVDGGCYPYVINSNTVGYSNCKIGLNAADEPIKAQIRKWQKIENMTFHFPEYAKEIPYEQIKVLMPWSPIYGIERICK